MAPNIFGLRRVSRMDTFSSFGSFRDVKSSLACFLKLCSCAMFACGCAMFACGYAVLARDQTHFLHSTSCCLLWNDGISHGCAMFFQLRHVFADAPCFYWCAIIFCVFGLRQKFWEQDSLDIYIYTHPSPIHPYKWWTKSNTSHVGSCGLESCEYLCTIL